MSARNDVTGDKIQTKVKEKSYYDSPFWDFVEKNRERLAGGSDEEGAGVEGEGGESTSEVDACDSGRCPVSGLCREDTPSCRDTQGGASRSVDLTSDLEA